MALLACVETADDPGYQLGGFTVNKRLLTVAHLRLYSHILGTFTTIITLARLNKSLHDIYISLNR